jgi:hypothetical protein
MVFSKVVDGGDSLQILRVAANKLSHMAVKGCGHLLGVGYGVLTTHHYKKHYITKR